MRTIDRIKQKCMEESLDAVLERAASNRICKKKVDGDLEAGTVQLCCSDSPKGYAEWSLRMLADKAVEPGYVDRLSHVSAYSTLKKTNLNRGK